MHAVIKLTKPFTAPWFKTIHAEASENTFSNRFAEAAEKIEHHQEQFESLRLSLSLSFSQTHSLCQSTHSKNKKEEKRKENVWFDACPTHSTPRRASRAEWFAWKINLGKNKTKKKVALITGRQGVTI